MELLPLVARTQQKNLQNSQFGIIPNIPSHFFQDTFHSAISKVDCSSIEFQILLAPEQAEE
jgi:hypothetical protein